jgi:class 3 adenylate cyclase
VTDATSERGLGLGQYEATFRENEIDAEVLLELTDTDLEKIGVPLGHRTRLLKAIASLGPAETQAQPIGPPPTLLFQEAAAERRQITVMFCDVVGSIAMSARLDPEDMREVIRAFQDACSGAVARYDGFVAKFMGDGVLAYFGFPRAHEEDAERAVRAALDISAGVATLDTRAKETLRVRIGIATGVVVIGDLVGQGSAQEQAVVGETPNLAARLQGGHAGTTRRGASPSSFDALAESIEAAIPASSPHWPEISPALTPQTKQARH